MRDCLCSNAASTFPEQKTFFNYSCFLAFSRYGYLQRYITEPGFCKGDEWHPLVWYRNSLLANEEEESSVTGGVGEWSSMSPSKISTFKRKLSNGMKTPLFFLGPICVVPLVKIYFLTYCVKMLVSSGFVIFHSQFH